jgi:Na+-driven multidrug efflux pump
MSCQQTFVAIGEAKISLFLALFRKIIVLIPLIYLLPNFFTDKVFAVFLAEPVADTIAATTTTTLFVLKFRKLSRAQAQTLK